MKAASRSQLAVLFVVLTLILAGCTDKGGGKGSEQAASPTPAPVLGLDPVDESTGDVPATPAAPGTPEAPPTIGAAPAKGPDLGFRPPRDGFPFENYVNSDTVTNLTPADMKEVYGPAVCSDPDGKCRLTPPAKARMNELNRIMAGGHCYGMSVASLLFFKDRLKPARYGAPKVKDFKFAGNDALQREVAQRFIAQTFPSVLEKRIIGSPNEILDAITRYVAAGSAATETYTVAFFKPDFTGGHAVTPYSVVDRGKGKFQVLIYDNNHPGAERRMNFDRNANTWSYQASTNPKAAGALYQGNAATRSIQLYPVTPGLGRQPCPFCAAPVGSAAPQIGTVSLVGAVGDNHPHLLITGPDGKRTGYVDGTFVNEVPGVEVEHPILGETWKFRPEPTYKVPLGMGITVTIDGAGLQAPAEAEINYIGQGRNVTVGNLEIRRGEQDVLTLPGGGAQLTYRAGAARSPVFELGSDDVTGADYGLTVKAGGLLSGGAIGLGLDTERLALDTTAAGGPLVIDLGMARQDTAGVLSFNHDGIRLDPSTAALQYAGWSREGEAIPFDVTTNGVSRRYTLADGRADMGPPEGGEPAPVSPDAGSDDGDVAAPPDRSGSQARQSTYVDLRFPGPNGSEIVIHLELHLPYWRED